MQGIEARVEMNLSFSDETFSRKVSEICQKEIPAEELVGVLFHGSRDCAEANLDSDWDLAIILRKKNPVSLLKLGEIFRTQEVPSACFPRILFLSEMPQNADFYSQNTNGSFFAWHMRTATVLYGENPFDKMVGPSPYQLALSLWQKSQQYTGEARKAILRSSFTEKECTKLFKNVLKTMKDLMMLNGRYCKTKSQCLSSFMDKFVGVLDEEDFSLMTRSIDAQCTVRDNDMNKACMRLWKIQESVYSLFLDEIKTKLKVDFLTSNDL